MRLLGYEDPALPELLPVSRDKMAETYDEPARDLGADLARGVRGGEAFRQDPAHRPPPSSTSRPRRRRAAGRPSSRQQGVRAARHLRLPDRPHAARWPRSKGSPSTRRASAG
jgi:hypothetical protein